MTCLYKASEWWSMSVTWQTRCMDSLVATVGQLNVSPNAFSVIPGRVDLTLQIRDIYVDTMEEFVKNIIETFDLRYKIIHSSEPTMCDTDIINTISDVSHSLGLKSIDALTSISRCSELHLVSYGYDLCSHQLVVSVTHHWKKPPVRCVSMVQKF